MPKNKLVIKNPITVEKYYTKMSFYIIIIIYSNISFTNYIFTYSYSTSLIIKSINNIPVIYFYKYSFSEK